MCAVSLAVVSPPVQHDMAMTAELEKHPLLPISASNGSSSTSTPFHHHLHARPTRPPDLTMTPSSLHEPLASSSSSSPSPSASPLELSSTPHKPSSSVPDPLPSSTDPHYTAHWFCFCLLGLINNFHFVVVLSAAFSLATSFNALPLIGVIQWATVILGMGTKIINTLYLLHTSYNTRIVASTATCLLGLAMLTLSPYFSFTFAIVAICFIGAYSALGESVILGYLRHFHPRLTGAWSAGTGLSGIAGTLAYLLLYSVCGLSNATIFLATTPTCIVYYLAFRYTETTAPASLTLFSSPLTSPAPLSHIVDDTTALIPPPASSTPASDSAVSSSPPPSRFAEAWRVARSVQRLCIHLTLVYVTHSHSHHHTGDADTASSHLTTPHPRPSPLLLCVCSVLPDISWSTSSSWASLLKPTPLVTTRPGHTPTPMRFSPSAINSVSSSVAPPSHSFKSPASSSSHSSKQ